jgi:hypothetical protein
VPARQEESVEIRVDIDREKTKVVITGDNNRDFEGPHELTAERRQELNRIYHSSGPSEDYGILLFRSTFREVTEQGIRLARTRTQATNGVQRRARFRLSIDTGAPELHMLWWETLTDPEGRMPLGRSRKTALSRHLPVAGIREPADADRLRVLVVVSDPSDLGESRWRDYAKLDKVGEIDVIRDALATDRAEFEVLDRPASPGNIRRYLNEGGFHVLHLVAHGGVFADDANQGDLGFLLLEQVTPERSEPVTNPVRETSIGQMIQGLEDLKLVVLASCKGATRSAAATFLGLAPRMVSYGVPAVVAMQDSVDVDTTRTFIRHFYESLGNQSGGFVDIAVNDAREEIFNEHLDSGIDWGWPVPVVFMRGEGLVLRPQQSGLTGVNTPRAKPPAELPVLSGELVTRPLSIASLDQARWVELPGAPQELLKFAWEQNFSEDEIRNLSYMVRLRYEDLRSSANEARLREIVQLCAEAGRLEHLREEILRQINFRQRRLMHDPAVQLLLARRPA